MSGSVALGVNVYAEPAVTLPPGVPPIKVRPLLSWMLEPAPVDSRMPPRLSTLPESVNLPPPVEAIDTTGAGDLYALLSIAVPATLTESERKLFEELRKTSRFDPRVRFR